MEAVCLRHTELPHTSRLFSDFLYRYHKVERFYTAPPTTGYPEDRRPALIEALRAQNQPSASLDLLAQPGAVAIVTGQQVGLFSGPAYTIYKALTAVKMARDLTERGRPAAPVFWLATEDHDFAEVSHAWVANAAHEPTALRLPNGKPGSVSDRPVGGVEIAKWPIEELKQALGGLTHGDEIVSIVEACYQPGATMGRAFRDLLESFLKPYGLIFLDPLEPAIRQLAAPILREAIACGPELNEALAARNRELDEAGYHAQVHVDSRTALFFLLEGGRRLPGRELRYSAEELSDKAHQLSPNALLRPVVQDYLLPTAAYIGGPAEVAYFAQSQVLYERLLGHMPRVVSRSGFTLLDSRTAKLMDRYQLTLGDCFGGEQELRERVAARLIPAGLDSEFEQTRQAVDQLLARLQSSVSGFDSTLASAVSRSGSKINHQLTKSRAKVAREILQRDERASSEARYLYNTLYPHKHLQERFYSILPFLARHGVDLIDRVYENVRLECPDHILLPV